MRGGEGGCGADQSVEQVWNTVKRRAGPLRQMHCQCTSKSHVYTAHYSKTRCAVGDTGQMSCLVTSCNRSRMRAGAVVRGLGMIAVGGWVQSHMQGVWQGGHCPTTHCTTLHCATLLHYLPYTTLLPFCHCPVPPAFAWWVASRFPLLPSFRRYPHTYTQRAH